MCAISVNQHASICGSNPYHDFDIVAGSVHATCCCDLPKQVNTTPPLSTDGSSINCEMNKFMDMIAYLSATDKYFEQIVPIDQSFVLFKRAWCVAEIAESHLKGMRQSLKIHSAWAYAKHCDSLRKLQVVNMEATRPEDKAFILERIPDTDAFDHHIQHLLFDELFPCWHQLDDIQQMTA